jgi:hypothetical protein
MTISAGADEKVYPVAKLATILDALAAEGAQIEKPLAALGLSRTAISSPGTRVSLNQMLDACRCADELSRDPCQLAVANWLGGRVINNRGSNLHL